jgi:hypothetical protein
VTAHVEHQSPDLVAMQDHCVKCKRAQHIPSVERISYGQLGCAWCRHVPPVFFRQTDYLAALAAGREWTWGDDE